MNENPAMQTLKVAEAMVAMWRAGKLLEAGEAYWADDVVSIEPFQGDMARLQGKQALAGKGKWWVGAHAVRSLEVGEPYVNGDQFIVRFTFELTVRESGVEMSLDELGAFTVRNGKVVEEKYFVLKAYFQR